MALGKGIPVINGFDLNSKLPLDSRAVADTMEEMNALVTNGSVTDGQLCYCKADKKLYVLKDGVWSEVGGGSGKSVPPTLNLIDFENGVVRTTITEEEYNNLKNGLYNQVMYTTENDPMFALSPSKLFSMYGEYGFVQFKLVANADKTVSYSSMVISSITIGEKNTSNEYPITIEDVLTINPPSSSSGSASSLNTIPYYVIENFNDGDHNDSSFVMPTEDIVLFTDGSGTSLIGYKNETSYFCYEQKSMVESGQHKYKGFMYRITKSNVGYNIEIVDLSEALNTNFEFLPNYSSSDNGKILAIDSGNPKWIASSSSSKTTSLFGRHSILVPLSSKDSDINLFSHSITSVNGNNQLLIQIYSSNNLPVNSPADLATVLVVYRKIIVSGIYENSPIFMLDWKGYASSVFYTVANPTTGIPLSNFTTFEDVVMTI